MRVALIGLYPVQDVITGGQEKITYLLAHGLKRRDDIDLHLIAQTPMIPRTETLHKNGLTIHAIRDYGVPAVLQYFTVRQRDTLKAIEAISPDVIHAQEMMSALQVARTGIPCVLTVHGMFHLEYLLHEGLMQWMVDRVHLHYFEKGLRTARYIISISPYVEQELSRFTSAEFVHIPNPVGEEFFRMGEDVEEEAGRLLCVGTLMPRKCTFEIVRAIEIVRRRFPDVRLRLVGKDKGGSYVEQVKAFAKDAGMERNVDFVGKVDEDQLHEEFRRCSILLLMSRQETAPGVIAEAMAVGKPVVASGICGVPYMVDDGKTGLLVAKDDVEGFADRIMKLLEDDDLRLSMGREGRAKALREYNNDVIVEQTINVYRKAVEAGSEAVEVRQ
ncbi:MAG: glycosyltransferase family 4 protein [Phycisphaerae bacterium]|nr:glycosyltransferase family 4 protein [Phycisphaerae bacterium]